MIPEFWLLNNNKMNQNKMINQTPEIKKLLSKCLDKNE